MASAARTAFPVNGNPITTSKAISFIYPDSGGQVAPIAGDFLVVLGFAVSEVGGTSAVKVRLHDGVDVTGPELVPLINVAANGFQQVLPFPNGVQVSSGKVFAEIIGSGSAEVCVYW